MEQQRYYFRVGLFAAVIIIGAIAFIGWLAGNSAKDTYIRYAIYFEGSVDGLSLGSPVKLKGIQVGNVVDIDFAEATTGSDLIRVLADIVDTAPIRSDTIAALQIQGITGTSFISLDNNGGDNVTAMVKPADQEYFVIQSKPSPLEKLFTSVPQLIDGLTRLSKQGQKLFSDENIAAVNSTIHSIEVSANTIGGALGGNNQASLRQSLQEMNKVMVEAKTTLREIKMLARTLREDPSIIIHGQKHEGKKLP